MSLLHRLKRLFSLHIPHFPPTIQFWNHSLCELGGPFWVDKQCGGPVEYYISGRLINMADTNRGPFPFLTKRSRRPQSSPSPPAHQPCPRVLHSYFYWSINLYSTSPRTGLNHSFMGSGGMDGRTDDQRVVVARRQRDREKGRRQDRKMELIIFYSSASQIHFAQKIK